MNTSLLLQDKTAVIYGASGAIGHAVAKTFAREGAHWTDAAITAQFPRTKNCIVA